jgi:hypothetical protein
MPGNPFDQFDPAPVAAPAPAGPQPLVVGNPRPQKPTFIPGTHQTFNEKTGAAEDIPGLKPDAPADKITYTQMTPQQKTAAGLDTSQPYYIGSDGLPKLPEGAKPGTAPMDPETARAHVSDILQQIDNATNLLNAPLTTGTAGAIFRHVPGTNAYTLGTLIGDPNDPKNAGQITADLRQQGIAYLRALNGGNGVGSVARNQAEQQALQQAMSNIQQGLPADQLKSALGNVKQIYLRAYARSYGQNPDDPNVQKQFGINPLWQPPGGYPAEPAQSAPGNPTKTDGGITASAPPPAIVGTGGLAASGTQRVVTDPKLAAIAPQLEQYLAADPKKVSNAMILGFMQKNGINNPQDYPGLMNDLQYRMSKEGAAWRARGGNYVVDPRQNQPLTGVRGAMAKVATFAPDGVPIGPTLTAAADSATLGTAPDVVGSLPGFTRSDLIQARDAAAAQNPGATLVGNLAGSFLPLPGAAEANALGRLGKAAGSGAIYGFASSEDPNIKSRLFNAAEAGTIAALAHGATDVGGRLAQAGYRSVARPVESAINGADSTADKYALNAAARKMPLQNLNDVDGADVAAQAAGVPQPAAASINRAGQDYLARAASSSPAARAVADNVAQNMRQQIPQQLAQDFNSAIEAAAPKGVDTTAYLNRPVRDIASDIQSMAGREYEKGIEPIKGERLELTPELSDALGSEQTAQAVKDALNTQLDPATRGILRNFNQTLKDGGVPVLSVDAARNIATALDRRATRMGGDTPEAVQLGDVAQDIRQAIGSQFPEYEPVNARYASRKNAIQAMYDARQNFLASTPDQIDALAKSSSRFTEQPNEGEFNGIGQDSGQTLPSNRQLAGVGAREATTVRAGENPAATADRLANNVNQQGNNATVLGQHGAQSVQNRAGVRANVANTVDNIQSGSTGDQTQSWFNRVKEVAMMKASGGNPHYVLAHAAASVPGLSSQDAARVVRLYLDMDSAPQVLQSLSSAYGARRARFIMARMAAVTAAATGTRGFPQGSGQ